MSKVIKNTVRAIGKVFGGDGGENAQATREAADQQAAALRAQADQQAQIAKQAADQQAQLLAQQAAAAAAARVSQVNQATVSNQQADAAQNAASTAEPTTPDVAVTAPLDSNDPRRKYQAGQGSIGATSGGAGIRI